MTKKYSFPINIQGLWLTANQIRRASHQEISKREFKALVEVGIMEVKKTNKKGQSIRLYKVVK